MIERHFPEILICPESGLALRKASPGLTSKINSFIKSNDIRDGNGEPLTAEADGFLLTEDRARAYPVRRGIPVLLSGSAFPTAGMETDSE